MFNLFNKNENINIHDLARDGKEKELKKELQQRPERLNEQDNEVSWPRKLHISVYEFVLHPSLLLFEPAEDILDLSTINFEISADQKMLSLIE